ncbi:unnamed protein product [Ectocarpus sp. 12 AP-2014]
MAFGGAFCPCVTISITSAPSMSTKNDALALRREGGGAHARFPYLSC